MREILFRGKRNDNGNWICGSFHKRMNECFIIPLPIVTSQSKVDPETVGQFTGLTDKNGKKIFEGDVLDCKSGLYERCKVIFNEFCSAFQLECADGFSDFFLCSINHKEMEVIGNIHDNPELLNGGADNA